MRRSRGQASMEMTLIIAVVTVTVVAAAATMIPLFRTGVQDLGGDVRAILNTGSVGGVGSGPGNNANGAASGRRGSGDRSDYEQAGEDIANGGVAKRALLPDPDIGGPAGI